jgi:hypothetical protein
MILETISKYNIRESHFIYDAYKVALPIVFNIVTLFYSKNNESFTVLHDILINEITLQCKTPAIEICYLLVLSRSNNFIIINSNQ